MTVDSPPSQNMLDALAATFWSKLEDLKAPTWSADIEQLVNPCGDLRMQPPLALAATPDAGVDEKLAMACTVRGISPRMLEFQPIGNGVRDEDGKMCVVCDVPVLFSKGHSGARHLRTKEHLCNAVYNLWIDPSGFLDGEEPFTCEFCHSLVTFRIDGLQAHMRVCPSNPDAESAKEAHDDAAATSSDDSLTLSLEASSTETVAIVDEHLSLDDNCASVDIAGDVSPTVPVDDKQLCGDPSFLHEFFLQRKHASTTREDSELSLAIDAMIASIKPGCKPAYIPPIIAALHEAEEARLREEEERRQARGDDGEGDGEKKVVGRTKKGKGKMVAIDGDRESVASGSQKATEQMDTPMLGPAHSTSTDGIQRALFNQPHPFAAPLQFPSQLQQPSQAVGETAMAAMPFFHPSMLNPLFQNQQLNFLASSMAPPQPTDTLPVFPNLDFNSQFQQPSMYTAMAMGMQQSLAIGGNPFAQQFAPPPHLPAAHFLGSASLADYQLLAAQARVQAQAHQAQLRATQLARWQSAMRYMANLNGMNANANMNINMNAPMAFDTAQNVFNTNAHMSSNGNGFNGPTF